jgi:hypothetical protein
MVLDPDAPSKGVPDPVVESAGVTRTSIGMPIAN